MFKHILLFELRYNFKRVYIYIVFALFALLGFIAIHRAAVGHGFLNALTRAGTGNVSGNAPYAVYYLIAALSYIGTIISCGIFGAAAMRDFKYGTHELYFSYPVRKLDYLAARFTVAALLALFIFSGIGIGAIIGSIAPFTNKEGLGPNGLFLYIQPYIVNVIPNILFTGAVFFSLALFTRKLLPVYAGGVALLFFSLLAGAVQESLSSFGLASLLDPFGRMAASGSYHYWTVAQKNSLLIPFIGPLLFNRLLWLGLGVIIFVLVSKKFRFSALLEGGRKGGKHPEARILSTRELSGRQPFLCTEKVPLAFTFRCHLRQMLASAWTDFRGLVSNVYFLAILVMGAGLIFYLGFRNVGLVRGTPTLPVTSQLLEVTKSPFYLISLLVILFSSGELIWRERRRKVNVFCDALPVPEWVPFLGKVVAAAMIQLVLVLVVMVSGIAIQIIKGYANFEILLYVKELFCIRWVYFTLLGLFALVIQVVVNHKLLGWIVTILFVDDFLESFGFEHHLWTFGTIPSSQYSDMNGYGPFANAILYYNLYWIPFSIVLVVLALLLWVRGCDTGWRDRIRAMKGRLTKQKKWSAVAAAALCIVVGSFIFYNTTILNAFATEGKMQGDRAGYEMQYKKYETSPQPRCTDIKVDVDIYPEERKVLSKGRMKLKNKFHPEVSHLLVRFPRKSEAKKLAPDRPHSVIHSSDRQGVRIFKLKLPLLQGEEMDLLFDFALRERGFKDRDENTRLVQNGTFLDCRHLIPSVGYDRNMELDDKIIREQYGLPPRERMPGLNNEAAWMYNVAAQDADWIDYEAVLSTAADQVALTSGGLIREWKEGNRKFFHYKTKHKILKYLPFVSASYEVKRDQWKGIPVEVYYHPGHDCNVDLMIDSAKKSLATFAKAFSPYPFSALRIVEFPRYQIYAEAFPSLIPVSEGYGFIANRDDTRVEYLFRVTAHEVGHQWWAHQVICAAVEGGFLITEAMAQYSALLVIREEYDQEKLNNYMKKRIDVYLRGRAGETSEEKPLVRTNFQTHYVHYDKGMVAMNALLDYLGEEKLSEAIGAFYEEFAFQEPPYPTSMDFIHHILAVTPDELRYFIADLFETITLYENKAEEASFERLEDGKYKVRFRFQARKLRADELGNEIPAKFKDLITFGVLGKEGEALYLEKHWVTPEMNELEFIVEAEPAKVGIDPHYCLIDKNPEDNIVDVD